MHGPIGYVIRSLNNDSPTRASFRNSSPATLFPDNAEGVVPPDSSPRPWDYVGHVELSESKTDGLIAATRPTNGHEHDCHFLSLTSIAPAATTKIDPFPGEY